jgi:hypothetical protein
MQPIALAGRTVKSRERGRFAGRSSEAKPVFSLIEPKAETAAEIFSNFQNTRERVVNGQPRNFPF